MHTRFELSSISRFQSCAQHVHSPNTRWEEICWPGWPYGSPIPSPCTCWIWYVYLCDLTMSCFVTTRFCLTFSHMVLFLWNLTLTWIIFNFILSFISWLLQLTTILSFIWVLGMAWYQTWGRFGHLITTIQLLKPEDLYTWPLFSRIFWNISFITPE